MTQTIKVDLGVSLSFESVNSSQLSQAIIDDLEQKASQKAKTEQDGTMAWLKDVKSEMGVKLDTKTKTKIEQDIKITVDTFVEAMPRCGVVCVCVCAQRGMTVQAANAKNLKQKLKIPVLCNGRVRMGQDHTSLSCLACPYSINLGGRWPANNGSLSWEATTSKRNMTMISQLWRLSKRSCRW